MSRQILKSCAVIALSLALLYSGVAWAMEGCLRHNGHHDQTAVEDRHQHESHSEHAHPRDHSVPVIHCAPVMHQVGPAVQVSSTQLTPSSKGVPLQAFLLPEAVKPVFGNDLWLEAVFKRFVPFSLPSDLARHLFLSVLQI